MLAIGRAQRDLNLSTSTETIGPKSVLYLIKKSDVNIGGGANFEAQFFAATATPLRLVGKNLAMPPT